MVDEEFRIERGMPVVDPNARSLGEIESILSENGTDVSRFIVVDRRLVPVEAIRTVAGGRLVLDVPEDRMDAFPERRGLEMPTPEMQDQAYAAIDLTGPVMDGPDGRGATE